MLGSALKAAGRLDEAIIEHRKAIALNKDLAKVHVNLANALQEHGEPDEAVAEYREGIRLGLPKSLVASVYVDIGKILCDDKHDYDGAIAAFREALQLKGDAPLAHRNLGNALLNKGQLDEAIQEYRAAIGFKEDYAEARYGLGNALLHKKQLDGAIQEYGAAIRFKADYAEAHCGLGLALWRKGQLDQAVAQLRKAINLKPDLVEAHNILGALLCDAKHDYDGAIVAFREALRLQKNNAAAHRNLAIALSKKRLLALETKLPQVLQGKAQPADAVEQVSLAWICQQPSKALYAASARFYRQAFADKGTLAADLKAGHRYNAACAAALAGCGHGKDADKLDAKERAGLRKQALDWLRADLKALGREMDDSAEKAGPEIAQQMQLWLRDIDFVGVRGAQALGRLPEAERGDWQKLWEEVEALQQRAAISTPPASATRQ
jgi:tetratricopeptide (TPR) repeat protein